VIIAVLIRLLLLAGGLGLTEIAMTSLAAADPVWAVQIALGLAFLVAGTAGLVTPLLRSQRPER
jgi:hypothetical protein